MVLVNWSSKLEKIFIGLEDLPLKYGSTRTYTCKIATDLNGGHHLVGHAVARLGHCAIC